MGCFFFGRHGLRVGGSVCGVQSSGSSNAGVSDVGSKDRSEAFRTLFRMHLQKRYALRRRDAVLEEHQDEPEIARTLRASF